MSTNIQGFRSFFRFLYHFVLAKLATSSIHATQQKIVSVADAEVAQAKGFDDSFH